MASKLTRSGFVSSAKEEGDTYPFERLVQWLEAAAAARGAGGKKEVAALLGISPSNFSQILARKAGFDQKTMRLMSLIASSKAELYPDAEVVGSITLNGIVVETRASAGGETIYTWRTGK